MKNKRLVELRWYVICLVTSVGFLLTLAWINDAQSEESIRTSPVGIWKTLDEDTRKPEALVRIKEKNGVLHAKVVKLFATKDDDKPLLCTWCKGNRKNRPIVGMTVMGDLKKRGDKWRDGWVFDPDADVFAKCELQLVDDGRRLKVKGYLNFLISETHIWTRVR